MILLDSTVIVGFLDADDALHEVTVAKLKDVIRHHAFVASAVNYAEVMTGVALGHHDRASVDGFFGVFIKDLLPVDRPVAARAAILRGERRSLPMPDALILATADMHDEVDTVLCGDSDWPKIKGLSCAVELLRIGHQPGKAT